VDAARPQRKRTTEKHLEKRSGEGTAQWALGSAEGKYGWPRQSWMEMSGLWPMLHWE